MLCVALSWPFRDQFIARKTRAFLWGKRLVLAGFVLWCLTATLSLRAINEQGLAIYRVNLPYERYTTDLAWIRGPIFMVGIIVVAITQGTCYTSRIALYIHGIHPAHVQHLVSPFPAMKKLGLPMKTMRCLRRHYLWR